MRKNYSYIKPCIEIIEIEQIGILCSSVTVYGKGVGTGEENAFDDAGEDNKDGIW